MFVYGERLVPDVVTVEATFDNGQTVRDAAADGVFLLRRRTRRRCANCACWVRTTRCCAPSRSPSPSAADLVVRCHPRAPRRHDAGTGAMRLPDHRVVCAGCRLVVVGGTRLPVAPRTCAYSGLGGGAVPPTHAERLFRMRIASCVTGVPRAVEVGVGAGGAPTPPAHHVRVGAPCGDSSPRRSTPRWWRADPGRLALKRRYRPIQAHVRSTPSAVGLAPARAPGRAVNGLPDRAAARLRAADRTRLVPTKERVDLREQDLNRIGLVHNHVALRPYLRFLVT